LSCSVAIFVDFECEFGYKNIANVGELYRCLVKINPSISHSSVTIHNISGNHINNNSHNNITFLAIEKKTVEYLPLNLGEKFKNLVGLKVKNGKLKEIHQDDLKRFTNLKHLNLDDNNLEALDNDLFEFNTKLKIIWLANNKIKSIGKTTFDRLTKLSDLDLSGNICTQERVNGLEMKPNISKINQQCFNPDIELENLKLMYRNLKNKSLKTTKDVELLRNKNAKLSNGFENLKKILKLNKINFNETAEKNQLNNEIEAIEDEIHIESNNINDISAANKTILMNLENLKTEKSMLEKQLNFLITQSQNMELNMTAANDKCTAMNHEIVVQLDKIRNESDATNRNLTANIKNLKNESHILEIKNNQLEEIILNIKYQLQIEEVKLNETRSINTININQLQDYKRSNAELSKQLDKMNATYQSLKKSLADERKRFQNKNTKFKDILSFTGNKFDDVQYNLTAKFDGLYNKTSELLAKQQIS